MKKKLSLTAVSASVALVLGVGMAVGLSGCGGGGGTTIVVSGPLEQHDWLVERLNQYNLDNGTDYTFDVRSISEADIDTAVTDWTTGPNVYAFASDKIQGLFTKNALAAVPEEYQTQIENEVNETSVEAATFASEMYAYPYTGDNGYFLFYNSTLLQESQVDDLYSLVDLCKEEGWKIHFPIRDSFYGSGWMFSFGARYSIDYLPNGQIENIEADFNGANGLKAAKALVDILKYGSTGPNPTDNIIDTARAGAQPVSGEPYVATVNGTWAMSAADFAAVGEENIGMTKLPKITYNKGLTGEETVNCGSFLGYKLYGVNPQATTGGDDKLAISHSVAMYLYGKDTQESRFDALGVVPTNEEVLALDRVQDSKTTQALGKQSEFSVPQTAVPGGLWSAVESTIGEICDQYLTLTDAELQTMLDGLNDAIEASE